MKQYTADTITTWISDNTGNISEEEYYKNLKRRQQEHLDGITGGNNWQPCLHDACPECVGTGLKRDGGFCVHALSCPCPKCSPRF